MPVSPRREVAQAVAYLAVITALAIFYAAISYQAHQSFTYYPNGGWYGELARAFQQGQVSLLSKPSKELLTSANPYSGVHQQPFKLDISFYHGKYYLYFGPAPTVLFFYPWLLLTGHVLNQALVYWFLCVTGLIVFGLFLAAAVRLHFPSTSVGMQVLLLLLFGLGAAQAYCIHLVLVYEIAEATSFLFLLAMFYFLFLALHRPARPTPLLMAAGFCLAIAVGARANAIFYGLVFVPVFFELFRGRRLVEPLRAGLLAALPLGTVIVLLLCYNQARFGRPLDFGLTYQISNQDYSAEPRFRLSNIVCGVPDLTLMPPRLHLQFPFLFPEPPRPGQSLLNPRPLSGPYIGLLFTLPIFLYGLGWTKFIQERRLRLFTATAMVSAVFMLVFVSGYFTLSYRYSFDFLAPFFLLTTLSVLAMTQTAWTGPVQKWLFWGACAWSLYMGFGLSLIGEFNGIRSFHTHPPPALGELWLPDGERAQPWN